MKKIFFFLLVFFISSNIALANNDIYYSDYSDFSDWSLSEVKENETTIVEHERRYKWYKENTLLGDYYIEGENNLNFPIIDKNDYIETSFSNWQEIKPLLKSNRIINSRYVYEYQDMKEVRYIHLSDLQGSYGSLRISEIEVYAGNQKVNYDLYCEGCNSNFNSYIDNNMIIENMSYINNGGYLRIDLNNYYPLDSLNIKIYLFDTGTSAKRYTIKITRDSSLTSNIYSEVTIANYFTYNYLNEIVPFNYDINQMKITNPEWYSKQRSFDVILPSKTRVVEEITEYQYKDILYRYYNTEKLYYEDYSKDIVLDYNLKDEIQYQDYYRYKKRDKVIMESELFIDNKNTKLEDFILSSTTDDFKIESNMNINQNGVYKVNFIFPFKTITKDVKVDILDNTLEDFYSQIANLNNQNNQLQSDINKKENEINQLIDNLKQKDIEIFKLQEQSKLTSKVTKETTSSKQIGSNTTKMEDIITKIQQILHEYDDKIKTSLTIIEQEKDMIEVMSNENKLLKSNYLTTLNQTSSNEKSNINEILENNYVLIIGLVLLIIIFLIIFQINKKRSN